MKKRRQSKTLTLHESIKKVFKEDWEGDQTEDDDDEIVWENDPQDIYTIWTFPNTACRGRGFDKDEPPYSEETSLSTKLPLCQLVYEEYEEDYDEEDDAKDFFEGQDIGDGNEFIVEVDDAKGNVIYKRDLDEDNEDNIGIWESIANQKAGKEDTTFGQGHDEEPVITEDIDDDEEEEEDTWGTVFREYPDSYSEEDIREIEIYASYLHQEKEENVDKVSPEDLIKRMNEDKEFRLWKIKILEEAILPDR